MELGRELSRLALRPTGASKPGVGKAYRGARDDDAALRDDVRDREPTSAIADRV